MSADRPPDASRRTSAPGVLAVTGASLGAIHRLTATTAQAETLDEIHAAALDVVASALGATRAAILLFDPEGVMRFQAWRGISDQYRRATEGHSPWPRDAMDPQPVLVPDVRAGDGLGSLRATVLGEGIQALAFFPLVQPGRLLGKFMAYYETPHEFTPAEIMLGGIIAAHVAFAVQRRRTESDLQAHAVELADFFEHAPMGLHWVGPDGVILRANQAALSLLGYEREEYVGRHIGDFHVDRSILDEVLERLKRGETPAEYEAFLRHKDGTLRDVVVKLDVLWDSGRFVHARCFTRDVSDRRRADEVQARLAAIVESSNDVIVSKNLQGIIQTWNPAAERLFGYSAAEAIGRSITMLIPPESIQEERDILDRICRGLRIEHYETVRVTKDGRRIDVSLAISPVRDAYGRITGASKIVRDITDQKQARKEYEQLLAREQTARAEAEAANRAKDDFLATLSHELRTPLNSILGWTQVLSSARHDPGMVDRALDTISRNAKQQARLVEDLLDLSSILGGRLRLKMQSVDLAGVVSSAIESIRPAAADKELELHADFDASIGPVSGDRERLEQVFWNLLTNAVKFSVRGGRIDVRVERARSRAVVRIADTGIGMRPEMLPVIFERFRQGDSSMTRSHGGLGLGLAIVRQLVDMHGGKVEASSPGEGQGSTFSVELPIMPLQGIPGRMPATRAADNTRCDGIQVLLVDDEADGRELLAVYLEQCGATVTPVASAANALEVVASERPHVLVSDIAMPGMDGYELIRRLRALPSGNNIPAIALTAHASLDARLEALRAGYDLYLTKPVDAAELSAVVSRLGRRSKGG